MYQLITFQTTTLCLRNLMNRSHLRRSLPRKEQLPRAQAMWIVRGLLLLMLALGCFGLSPQARAVCQEGCLTGDNTVLGDDALLNNTGANNTAIGFHALYSNTGGENMGDYNTAIGAQALFSNTTGNRQHGHRS